MEAEDFFKRYESQGQIVDFNVDTRKALRVNTLKISEEELVSRLKNNGVKLEKIPFVKHGYFYSAKFSLGSTPEYLQGYYYLQEGASQVPAEVLDPQEEDLVLDMCAAPGSKTTQLAQLMNNKGKIIAIDVINKRLESLNNNLERMGVVNTSTFLLNAKDVTSFNLVFDKVLLDAPCSGNFVTDKGWIKKRDMPGIKNNSDKQKSLLERAFNVLKPGGICVYSTCSLEIEEDEDNVSYARFLGFEVLDSGLDFGTPGCTEDSFLARKFWPNLTRTQGFFVVKLKKPENNSS